MKVKICGIKTLEIAQEVVSAGADFMGFIFFPKSKRYILPQQAAKICLAVTGSNCARVGVFVNEDIQTVNAAADLCQLDYVQLHGSEDEAYARKIERPVIKAFRWGNDFQVERANAYPAEIILLDSFSKDLPGGTGQTFAWHEAAKETQKLTKPLLLAGGIKSSNFRQAEDLFHPFGIDVSGGLETHGEKSVQKICEFMMAVRRE